MDSPDSHNHGFHSASLGRLSAVARSTAFLWRITMRSTTTLVATATAIALGALGWSYAAAEDELITIAKQLQHQWVEAYNNRDSATLASMYIEDAIVTPEGQPDLQKFFAEKLKQSALDNLQLTRSDLTRVGTEVVIGRGTWSGEVKKGGKVPHATGTYLVIAAKRSDGQWKLLSFAWNWDPLPIAPLATGSGTDEQPHAGTSTPNK
jgi:ketosteroid isomerase-like protein